MKNITLIGAGAVGRSIALALFYRGYQLLGIYSQSGRTAQNIGKRVKAKDFGLLEELKEKPRIIIIAVKDSEIRSVVNFLSRQFVSLSGVTVLHTSGVLSSSELNPLRRKGASIGSFHPMQTFPQKNISGKEFENSWIAIEGDKKAISTSRKISSILKAKNFVISANNKILYHIAGVFASNYLVTILFVVEQIARRAKIQPENLWKIFLPIINKTITNVATTSPKDAITGVIERKDIAMIKQHLGALNSHKLKHLIPLYAALGIETARLVKEKHAR